MIRTCSKYFKISLPATTGTGDAMFVEEHVEPGSVLDFASSKPTLSDRRYTLLPFSEIDLNTPNRIAERGSEK